MKENLKRYWKLVTRAYEKWTKKEEDNLKKWFSDGKTINKIAKVFERQPSAIISKLKKIGLL